MLPSVRRVSPSSAASEAPARATHPVESADTRKAVDRTPAGVLLHIDHRRSLAPFPHEQPGQQALGEVARHD